MRTRRQIVAVLFHKKNKNFYANKNVMRKCCYKPPLLKANAVRYLLLREKSAEQDKKSAISSAASAR